MEDKVIKNLDEYITAHSKNEEKVMSFVEYLYTLLDKYNITNPADVYNKVNISRQLWSTIISNKTNPSLNTCIKIALGIGVNKHECKYLLKKAGYTLASSNKYSLIIRYAIENKIYNINDVNDLLIKYGYEDSLLI